MTFLFASSFFVCSSFQELLALRSVVRTYSTIWFKSASIKNKYGSGRSKRESYSYLIDDTAARDIAKYVREHTTNDAYVFEANPGPGILSRALLESGIPRLRVFEKEGNSSSTLQELASSRLNSYEIVDEDIISLPRLETKDFYEGTEESNVFFHGIQKRSWQEAPPISFVAVVSDQRSVNFMRSMLAKISLMSSLFAFGRCQFFLIFSEKEHTVPGTCLSSDHLSLKKKVKWEASNFYFAHLIPKADMFESVAPADVLPELYYFVRHHMTKRTDYVIPAMEKWVPSCGPRLILDIDGMKTFARFGDLSPSEMLRVFQLFSSWPEYEESMFKHITNLFFHECLNDMDCFMHDLKR